MSSHGRNAQAPSGDGSSDDSDDFYDNYDKYKKRKLGARAGPSNREPAPKRAPKPPPVKRENSGVGSSSDSSIDADDGLSAFERLKRRADKLKERGADVPREVDVFDEFDDEPLPPIQATLTVADNKNLTDLLRSAKDDLEEVLPSHALLDDSLEACRLEPIEVTAEESFQSIPRRCMIHLRVVKTGKSAIVGWNMGEPFRKLLEEHAPRMGIDASKVILMGRDYQYSADQTPASVGLSEENVTEMDLFEEVPDPGSGLLPLKVQIRGKRPFVVKVPPDQRFAVLKETICREHALDVKKARMVFDNEMLDENSTPEAMEMEADDCVDVWTDK